MSVWGPRGSYSATTFVVVFFVGIAAVAHVLAPYIDQSTNPDLASSPSDFVRAAKTQPVRWEPWNKETLALARRLDRPLLIYFGTVWGDLRTKFDDFAADADVSEQMNREFVCVRIDAVMDPTWRGGPLQVERSLRGDSPGFGIAVIAPEGTLIAMPTSREMREMSDRGLLTWLRRALNTYAERSPPLIHETAVVEAFNLTGGMESTPGNPMAYAQELGESIDALNGSFRGSVYRELLPWEYEVMLDCGLDQLVESSLAPILQSEVHDALWGGYFERWQPSLVVYAKTATSNAGMLNLLARLAIQTGAPIYDHLARQQFDFLESAFAGEDSPAYEYSVFGDANRSLRHSFSPRRLRQTLTDSEYTTAVELLGLDVSENPQMTPYIRDLESYFESPGSLDKILTKMRAVAVDVGYEPAAFHSYESQALAVESLLRSSRYLNDSSLRSRAISAFGELRGRMRIGLDDVLAAPQREFPAAAPLPCYLAYAGAAWEMTMLTGSDEYARDGLAVLERAHFLFTDPAGGLYAAEEAKLGGGWSKLFAPEVLDLYGASTTSEFVRLAGLYGRWSAGSAASAKLRHSAQLAIQRVGWILDPVPLRAGNLAHVLAQEQSGVVLRVPAGAPLQGLFRLVPDAILLPSSSGKWEHLVSGRWVQFASFDALAESLRGR